MTRPVTQVQIHHRRSAGRLSRTMSRTISAMAHPAVTDPGDQLIVAFERWRWGQARARLAGLLHPSRLRGRPVP